MQVQHGQASCSHPDSPHPPASRSRCPAQVRSGGMCNPGELCSSTGMSEGEMMKLVEQKMRGGVPPPWEWALVTR